jgi:hypothetical protein
VKECRQKRLWPNVVYEGVIPAAQHRAISKLARQTNHVERFNNTLRQRVSRLVREALSFSKKLVNHIGAIKMFICHYNLTRAAASSEHYMDITTPRAMLSCAWRCAVRRPLWDRAGGSPGSRLRAWRGDRMVMDSGDVGE